MTDLALARSASRGDDSAFNEIYERYAERLYYLCLRMTGETALAQELTQDIFIQVWKKLGSYRGESQLGTWLHRVAVNQVLSRQRLTKRDLTNVEDSEIPHVHPVDIGSRLDLERALSSLPPGARMTVVLHDIEGYKYREIAEMLNIDIGTVKAQLHRGRTLIRKRWQK